jgi:transketolase
MNLKLKSIELRRNILDIVYTARAGHIGSGLSVCDILNVLYNKHMDVTPDNFNTPNHDRFILSKGHAVEALYAVLCDKRFFPRSDLWTVSKFGSTYIGHPTNKIPGIEMNSGSLGHGLSVGAGMALAGRMDSSPYRVYVVMGDGELAEGSVWEGAMLAGHYGLDNLTAVIDRNTLQISGPTEQIMRHEDLRARWEAFGWYTLRVMGNDTKALDDAFTKAKAQKDAPTVIIANTIKGAGISFMENRVEWHHRVPTRTEYEAALAELAIREKEVSYE